MKIKERHYPHPVLWQNSDDFFDTTFTTDLSVDSSRDGYTLNTDFSTTSGYLRELVSTLTASYAIHVECSSTRYREIFLFNRSRESFIIPSNLIDGKVEVCTFILANEYIPKYRDRQFHPDFEDISFEVWKGDVLAVGDELTFDADLVHDPLRKVPSIFSVQKSTSKEPMEVSAIGNKIVISLSSDNFDKYNALKNAESIQPVLSSLVIVPALVYVLEDLKAYSEEDLEQLEDESRWFRVLKRKLKDDFDLEISNISSSNESTLLLAQKLIGDPVTAALGSLYDVESDNE